MTLSHAYQEFERKRLQQAREKSARAILDKHVAYQHSQAMPRLRMIVSPWFKDDNGVATRIVRAAE